jgi:hypothetical protein
MVNCRLTMEHCAKIHVEHCGDGFGEGISASTAVIPAQAGIQGHLRWPECVTLDSRLRGNDTE